MRSEHRRRPLQNLMLACLLLCLALVGTDSAVAQGKGKGGGGGGGEPPANETVFFATDSRAWAMDTDGSSPEQVDPNVVSLAAGQPSSLVYGSDTSLDRWWLTVLESGQIQPNGIPQFDVYAVHPGRGLQVQVTDLFGFANVLPNSSVVWSNDGVDSFFGFLATFDEYSTDAELFLVAMSGADLDTAIMTGIWSPVDPLNAMLWGPLNLPNSGSSGRAIDLSPDGTRALHVDWVSGARRLNVAALDGSGNGVLWDDSWGTPSLSGVLPRWSPGAETAAFSGGNVYVVPTDGSSDPVRITSANFNKERYGASLAWSPDGTKLAVKLTKVKFGVPTGGNVRILTETGSTVANLTDGEPIRWTGNLAAPGY